MFTLQQLKDAHSKVKSGADFPAYLQEIITCGVLAYTTFVTDGNTVFEGKDNYTVQSGAKYPALKIADTSNKEQFIIDIKAHQQGKSNFVTFCQQCAQHGIEKWVVDTSNMTCSYYDKAGNELLVEIIPGR